MSEIFREALPPARPACESTSDSSRSSSAGSSAGSRTGRSSTWRSCASARTAGSAWDEAVEVERTHDVGLGELTGGRSWSVEAGGGEDHEPLRDARGELAGRLVRQRWPVRASVFGRLEAIGGLYRLTVSVDNQASADGMTAEDALRRSLVGTHLIIEAGPPAAFVSVIDPPADAREAAGHCQQLRCWPVLAGEAGRHLDGPGLADHPLRLPGDRRRRVPEISSTERRSTRSSPCG